MRRGLALSFGLGWAIAACGSSDQKDLFGGNPGGSAGSASGGSTSSGGSAGSVSTGGSAGSTGGSSGVGGIGGSAGSAAAAGVGGAAGDAGTAGAGAEAGAAGAGGSAGVGGDAGSGGVGGAPPGPCTGHCGETQAQPDGCYCDAQCLQSNDCCADFASSCGGAGKGQVGCFDAGNCSLGQSFCCMNYNDGDCVPPGSSCFNDAAIHCDGPEDCGSGQVCCGNLEQGGSGVFWTDFTCKSPSQCAGSSDYTICGSDASVCTGGTVCKQSGSMPQIRYCGQP